jgi:protein-S-isoprenylcysteine O-methyltransferase Ste14
VALALIVILDLLVPVPFLPQAVSLAIGVPLLVLGVGLWAWGVSGLLRRGESPDPRKATTQLVTGGPYRFSRNPIYTGGTVGLLGLALLLDTATGAAVVVALALLARNLILAEERYLEAKFGHQWREYRSRVRRWI